ncbi:hypothetical protein BH09ACT5_BH09ACT5_18540 [soil metagenome]
MSPGPRIVFTRFLTGDSPKLVPWVEHARQVTARTAEAGASLGPEASPIVWQLVSGNNRHLARSVAIHSSFEDAAASARGIIAARADLLVELVSQPTRGSYGWYAADGGAPVMLCARWYVTPRDRRHSLALALRCLDEAELDPGVRVVYPAPKESAPELFLA